MTKHGTNIEEVNTFLVCDISCYMEHGIQNTLCHVWRCDSFQRRAGIFSVPAFNEIFPVRSADSFLNFKKIILLIIIRFYIWSESAESYNFPRFTSESISAKNIPLA
jgi:hypothetical protein